MTAENGIRTENKMKRLAAAIGVALAAVLAAASLSPARADAAGTSDGNLVIDVPTTVPCALMADGTVVSPSDWKITTSGEAYIASASASGFPANVEWSARTTDLAATQAGSVEVAGTGDAATVSGPSDPTAAALAGTARFEWSFSKLDAGKNSDIIGKAASGTAVLGSVTFTFAKPTTAFAVYSADDQSLTFYKRAGVPSAGQTFEGKAATEVFTGFETETYGSAGNVPWAGHAAELASVTVADAGIAPVSTAYWFNGASKLRSVDIAALDTSKTTCMDGMFQGCSSLESLDLSAMSTRRVASMTAFLGGCDSLAELSIGSEFAWVGNDCYPPTGNWKQGSTGAKYAESQIPSNKTDKYTRAKTAFAVYSADDQSLTFYKKFEAPVAGGVFEGKTATAVYTGFEAEMYGSAGNVPWAGHAADIASVTVADEGIAPRATAMWFSNMTMLRSADVSKLNTSNVTSMHSMFNDCKALTSLDLSSFDTTKVTIMYSMFRDCNALTSLDVSSFDTRSVTNMCDMFNGCGSLTSLDLLSFNTNKVTDMYSMFRDCNALTSLDLSSFDTRSVTHMGSMFYSCNALTSLDLSSFDTTKVIDMSGMFRDCKALTELSLSSFNTDKVKYMSNMFSNCGSLTSLDLSSFNTRNVTSMYAIFSSCKALQKVAFGAGWRWVGTDGYLPTPFSAYIAGADGKWYNTDGKGYAPKDIPSNKAMTYTAIPPKTAFAVYSADDDSLSFYNRAEVPKQGAMYLGKKATAVYTGLENMTSAPGWMLNYSKDIKTATVYDEGISPTDTGFWFAELRNMKTADVSKLDMSKCKTISCMFTNCTSLEKLDLSAWDTRSLTSISQAFQNCTSLTKLNVSGWDVSKVTNMDLAFAEVKALGSLDLSTWDNSAVTSMKDSFSMMNSLSEVSLGSKFKFVGTSPFLPVQTGHVTGADGKWYDADGNGYAPENIPSGKTITYYASKDLLPQAFAVYSDDDGSLNFYKRVNVPSAGDRFEGKTVTAVYTGIEEKPTSSESPWRNKASKIKTATVVDNGIKPVSTANWLGSGYYNLIAADFTKLDTSNVTDMGGMFNACYSLTTVGDLSNWNTSNVTNMSCLFSNCPSLTTVGDLSNWNTSNVTKMAMLFYYASKLSVDCSNWDVSKAINHFEFNTNAHGVTVPLAWQASSDECVEDSAIAPLCEKQGMGDALNVPSESDKLESGSSAKTSTDVADVAQKAVEGVPPLEEKASEKSDMTTKTEGAEKTAVKKSAE